VELKEMRANSEEFEENKEKMLKAFHFTRYDKIVSILNYGCNSLIDDIKTPISIKPIIDHLAINKKKLEELSLWMIFMDYSIRIKKKTF